MGNFQVGDKVRVREDLVMGENYVIEQMLEHRGKSGIITKIGILQEAQKQVYYLDISGESFFWTNDMIYTNESGVPFKTAIATLTTRDFFKSKDKKIYIRDGVLKMEGFSEDVDMNEKFTKLTKFILQEILIEANHDKEFYAYIKSVTAPIIVKVIKQNNGKGFELENIHGNYIFEDFYLTDIAFADYVEVTE